MGGYPSTVYITVKNDDLKYNQDTRIGITHAEVVLSKEHPAPCKVGRNERLGLEETVL